MDKEDLFFLECGEELVECPKCHYKLLNPTQYSEPVFLSPELKELSTHELLFHSGEEVNILCRCYMCDYVWVVGGLVQDDNLDDSN